MLSEYHSPCTGGTPVWTRDVVYAGGRLLGAVRTAATSPTIAFTVSASSVSEALTSVTAHVVLTTPGGTPTTCPVSVPWQTQAGTATPGTTFDYLTGSGTLHFPAGTPSGTQQPITVELRPDSINEPDETFTIHLSGPSGAALQTPSVHTVTILDDDPAPAMGLDANDPAASEKTPFLVKGWAIDGTVPTGTGVDQVEVFAQPSGGSETSLGTATYGGSRPDIGTLYGSRFTNSGFSLTAHLAPGTYQVTVRARNSQTQLVTNQQIVNVTVEASNPQGGIEAPVSGTYAQPIMLTGWAIDLGTSAGTGVDQVTVTAVPTSGPEIPLGTAPYGLARSDIGTLYGAEFTNSGYQLLVRGLTPGSYTLRVKARSTVTGADLPAQDVAVTLNANPAMFVDTPASGASLNQSFTVAGWAIDFAAATGTGVDAVHL